MAIIPKHPATESLGPELRIGNEKRRTFEKVYRSSFEDFHDIFQGHPSYAPAAT